MKISPLDCTGAREHLPARIDGELADDAPLRAHLAICVDCGAHAAALAGLARGFDAAREPRALPDLWPAIERRLDPRRAPRARPARVHPALRNVAAALLGFAGIGAAALAVERGRERTPGRHLLERLAAASATPHELFAELPEYRLLRLAPSMTPSPERDR
jgi:predicted anti-sigma-YlaC factor YlaD